MQPSPLMYTCSLTGLNITKNSRIVEFNVTHLEGEIDATMLAVEFLDSNLQKIPQEIIDRFQNLWVLSAPNCGLETVNPLENCSNLVKLDLAGNQLSNLSSEFWENCRDLKVLNLSANNISGVMDSPFKNLTKLETLDLGFNSIGQLNSNSTFLGLQRLKTLNLTSNGLDKISLDLVFGTLDRLEVLDLTRNPFRFGISSTKFGSLRSLKALYFSGIQESISTFEETTFQSMVNLEELEITDNPLFQLGDRFFGMIGDLRKLTRLNLNWNFIHNISSSVFDNFENLWELSMANCQIQSITNQAFARLNKLRILNLAGNQIRYLNDTYFGKLEYLEVLNLSGNLLATFPSPTFNQLKHLRFLDVSFNSMVKLFKDDFNDFYNLWNLELQGNKINAIQRTSFDDLQLLRVLDLAGNVCVNQTFTLLGGIDSIKEDLEICYENSSANSKIPHWILPLIIFLLSFK
jgi:Leucine-rich repeat (LRR) protein